MRPLLLLSPVLALLRAYVTPQAGIVNRCADFALSLKEDAGVLLLLMTLTGSRCFDSIATCTR